MPACALLRGRRTHNSLQILKRLPELLFAQRGSSLLTVLIVTLALTVSAHSYIWYMQRNLTAAGARHRKMTGYYLAQAGIQYALAMVDRRQRLPHSVEREVTAEAIGGVRGRFKVSLTQEYGNQTYASSIGIAGDTSVHVSALITPAPRILLAALAGRSIQLEEASRTVITPWMATSFPWYHMGVVDELRILLRRGKPVIIGNQEPPLSAAPGSDWIVREPFQDLRVLLGPRAVVATEAGQVNQVQLELLALPVDLTPASLNGFPPIPTIDKSFYRQLAGRNRANGQINAAAGRKVNLHDLETKTDSFYTPHEMVAVLDYLQTQPEAALSGVVYVTGGVDLQPGMHLRLVDGMLLAESNIQVGEGAELDVIHHLSMRRLPGVFLLEGGALMLEQAARVRIDGLLYAEGTIDISSNALLEVAGAVIANDAMIGLRNAGELVILYDQSVLGTPGLRLPPTEPIVPWIASWQEGSGAMADVLLGTCCPRSSE